MFSHFLFYVYVCHNNNWKLPPFFSISFCHIRHLGEQSSLLFFCLHFVTPNTSGNSLFFLYVYVGHNKNHGFFWSIFVATRTEGNVKLHVPFMVFFIKLGTREASLPPFFVCTTTITSQILCFFLS